MSKKKSSSGKPGKSGGNGHYNTPKGGQNRGAPMSRRPPRQPGR
jgi:hypothetical protein